MNVIYQPKGRAREYAPLACNFYLGCAHRCRYCYAPACMHRSSKAWYETVSVRKGDVLKLFERDCIKLSKMEMVGEEYRVLFSFLSDPYQPLESQVHLTRYGIEIAERYGVKVDILTKGSKDLILEDLPLMLRAGTHLGITLSFINEESRKRWEPNASSVEDRLSILEKAHKAGVFTWVSMEPVIVPEEALAVVRAAHPWVDFWKVGKLNHNKDVERMVDWVQFREDVTQLLDSFRAHYYIKNDLRMVVRGQR